MRAGMVAAYRSGLLGLSLAASGCAGLGSLESILAGMGGLGMPGGSSLRGEIRYVDQRNRQIEVYTRNGQREAVGYDSRTEVLYQQRRYDVSSLEAGDQVAMEVEQDGRGRLFTRRVHVERSGQQSGGGRGGATGTVERFEGRVRWVDTGRGQFGLDAQYGSYTVTLPYNPPRSTLDAFRRLRQGSSVRIEGELLNQGRVEVRRFL